MSAGYETIAAMQNLSPITRPLSGSLLPPQRSWLKPDDRFFTQLLTRPELSPVAESCAAELALHAALCEKPSMPVAAGDLQLLADPDVRDSYALFLRFRDGLLSAGTLEAYYLSLFDGSASINIPPLFISLTAEAIVKNMLGNSGQQVDPPGGDHPADAWQPDAWQVRAAQMLYRSQRITTDDGQVLSGDLQTLDMLNDTGGIGDFGRFLAEAGAPLKAIQMRVLAEDNAAAFLAAAERSGGQTGQYSYLLDLRHEVSNDLSHGLVLTMTRARSGLKALAGVLARWVQHFTGMEVTVRHLQKIDDEAWRWHVGLDAGAMALLNDLYEGNEVEPERLQRLISLFRLDFMDPQDMRPDVSGKPVYLGLMMDAGGVVQIKPQNLLINLPLRRPA
jgi:hypothetical protein